MLKKRAFIPLIVLFLLVQFTACQQDPAIAFMRRYRYELAKQTNSRDSVAVSEKYINEKADSFPTLHKDSLQAMKNVVNDIWRRENETPETRITASDMGKAEFIEGEAALQNYIEKNLHYPVSAVEKRIEGTVVVGIVVDLDSTIIAVQLLTPSSNEIIAGEANRLALSMKNKMWKPAVVKKKAVRSSANLTVKFKLPQQ